MGRRRREDIVEPPRTHEEGTVDDRRFDRLSRTIGEQTDRRGMLKAAAGGTLALLGAGALGRAVAAQDVTVEAKGFKGDNCNNNNDCKKGLRCSNSGRCEYKKNCGGKKGDACKKTKDCCGSLRCKSKRCRR
jgi:hypothetical protein